MLTYHFNEPLLSSSIFSVRRKKVEVIVSLEPCMCPIDVGPNRKPLFSFSIIVAIAQTRNKERSETETSLNSNQHNNVQLTSSAFKLILPSSVYDLQEKGARRRSTIH